MNPQQPPGGYPPGPPGHPPAPPGYPPGPPGYPPGYPPQGQAPPGYAPNYYPQPGYGQPPQQPKQGVSVLRVLVGLVVALTVLSVVILVMVRAMSSTPRAQLGGTPGIGDLIGNATRSPQTLVDEQMAVTAHGWQSRGFSFPQPRILQVTVQGVKDADKGFQLYVVPSSECASFQPGQSIHEVPGFRGMSVRQFTNTGPIPAGSWCALVQNSENILNTMIVHIKIVTDPAQ